MRILMTGSSGAVGKALLKVPTVEEYLLPSHEAMPVEDYEKVMAYGRDNTFDLIVHLAGMTKVWDCEAHPSIAYEVNSIGTLNMTKLAEEKAVPIVYLSTDMVFDGYQQAPYTVDDVPKPLNEYGTTKLLGEKAVLGYDKGIVIRTNLFSTDKGFFVGNTIDSLLKGRECKVFTDVINTPVSASSLWGAIMQCVTEERYGIQHVATECPRSRLELVLAGLWYELNGVSGDMMPPYHLLKPVVVSEVMDRELSKKYPRNLSLEPTIRGELF